MPESYLDAIKSKTVVGIDVAEGALRPTSQVLLAPGSSGLSSYGGSAVKG
jgi:hypothetical protein